jgi:hypothetical protein
MQNTIEGALVGNIDSGVRSFDSITEYFLGE